MSRILAAFIFFTRLPFWRLADIPAKYFSHVVVFWPLTGWVTAGLSVVIFYAASLVMPYSIALLLAILTRLMVTGCLHEDGLADFMDGFGGGNAKEKILTIMKDSHTGSYGVIGLIVYFGSLYLLLSQLPLALSSSVLLAGDPFSKMIAAQTINVLPYARKEEEAKNKTIYGKMTCGEWIICLLCGFFPLFWLPSTLYILAIAFPVLIWIWLIFFMKQRIEGYTGDCCGATFLLCELSFYLGIVIVHFIEFA